MLKRRDVLKLSLAGAASAHFAPALAQAAKAQGPALPQAPTAASSREIAGSDVDLGPPIGFGPGAVVDLARELAKRPFRSVASDLPDPFKSLTFDQYNAIRLKPSARIWANASVGFVIEPLQRGFQSTNPIGLNLVVDGKAYKLIYATKLFDFGKLNPPPTIGDIDFSGFRVLAPHGSKGLDEIAVFQGTNFFHALADGQVAGIMARALALKVADPKGEEIPYFRQIWIEKPSLVEGVLVVHALVDSDSLTGAFRFTLRPGGATIIDIESTIFARKDIDNIGLASMSATHLLGFMDHKRFDDYRPNVSEVCGVQMLTGNKEWVWRPVTNRETLQISTFIDNKPRGFGCLIRNRDFEDYLDEDQHWQRRPSLWIEPLGDWAEGGVQLIEIPSTSDANDNILCFWRPKAPLKAGSESAFAYRQFWCWDPPERPNLARATRSHSGSSGKQRKFFIEFTGDVFSDSGRMAGASPTLTASDGSITMMKTYTDLEQKAYRVFFELDPGNAQASELRLVIEAKGQRLSETWLYRWTLA